MAKTISRLLSLDSFKGSKMSHIYKDPNTGKPPIFTGNEEDLADFAFTEANDESFIIGNYGGLYIEDFDHEDLEIIDFKLTLLTADEKKILFDFIDECKSTFSKDTVRLFVDYFEDERRLVLHVLSDQDTDNLINDFTKSPFTIEISLEELSAFKSYIPEVKSRKKLTDDEEYDLDVKKDERGKYLGFILHISLTDDEIDFEKIIAAGIKGYKRFGESLRVFSYSNADGEYKLRIFANSRENAEKMALGYSTEISLGSQLREVTKQASDEDLSDGDCYEVEA
jgi:hypothetical protein